MQCPAGMKFCGQCATPLVSLCPSCGASNPPEHKFCGQCATPIAKAAKPSFQAVTTRTWRISRYGVRAGKAFDMPTRPAQTSRCRRSSSRFWTGASGISLTWEAVTAYPNRRARNSTSGWLSLADVTESRALPERPPAPGELVQVRSRRWLVEEVVKADIAGQSPRVTTGALVGQCLPPR